MKIGIDLGGSHIGVGIIQGGNIEDTMDKNFTEEDRKDIQVTIINSIQNLMDQILNKHQLSLQDVEKIGIASPGTIENGTIIHAGNLGISYFNIIERLQEIYTMPIQIRNDGKCAAIAEKQYGAMKDYEDCVFINIGTGIGGAVFLGGKLLEPKRNSGFEIGHMVIQKNGNLCTCGKRGCFETYASIKALKTKIMHTLGIKEKDISGQYLREVLMVQYHDALQKDIEEYLDNLTIGISNLIDIFEPEVICLGGSFSYYEGNPVLEQLREKIKMPNTTFNNEDIKIVTADLKNNAGIIGATL